MPSIITCDQIGSALLAWLATATPEEKAALLLALGTPVGTQPALAPVTNDDPALPTVLFGTRDSLLGTPLGWFNVDGYVVPYYDIDNCP